MVLSKCKGTAMIIEWLKYNKKQVVLKCNDCKFWDDGFCSKQQMKCYYQNKRGCDFFELDLSKNILILLDTPDTWFTQKYLQIVLDKFQQLEQEQYLQTFISEVFLNEKNIPDRTTTEIWIDALVSLTRVLPKEAIEKIIKNVQNKTSKNSVVVKPEILQNTKTCKICNMNPTLFNQDICFVCKKTNENLSSSPRKINSSLQKIFEQCKKTAGCWFIVTYIKDVEQNYDKLQDIDFKKNYARKIYHETHRDCDVKNTIVRVNCMLRLVENGLTEYAYDYAINSKWF